MIVKRRRAPLPFSVCVPALLATIGADTLAAQQRSQSTVQSPASAPVDETPALPADLLPVPGRTIELGVDPDDLVEIGEKLSVSPEARLDEIPKLMPELGRRKVTLSDFYMSQTPVTNAQYQVFVEKTGHRYPFDWWRYGHEDDYTKRLPEIKAKHPEASIPALEYWKNNWRDLPHRIPDDTIDGKKVPMDDYPVVYVSYFDALAYAAWAGMRLPTEAEWVLMATGGERREFVWGNDVQGLKVQRGTRFDRMQPVGRWGEATQGPFGHQDLVLGVWEWTLDPFLPLPDDRKEFERARDALLRNRMFRDSENPRVKTVLSYRPDWSGDKIVVKGGMYSSARSELRIGTRAFTESIQTMAGLGFRVAKSSVPARDMALSWLKLDYDYSFAGGSRKPNLDDMVGLERYELGNNGKLILGYHALALVPMSHASDDARMNKDRLMQATVAENRPFVVGTLISTVPMKTPALPAGIYTLALRAEGMPDDLREALPAARKALRAAEKGAELEAGEWQKVLSKYGITDEEAKGGDVDFIRLNPGGLQIPTKERLWLVRDASGDYVASFPAAKSIDSKPGYSSGDATVTVAPSRAKDGGETVNFSFGIPVDEKARGRVYTVEVPVELAADAAGGDRWRLPEPKDPKKGK